MSHNRTSQYSAPFRRNNLLGLPQYIASDQFPNLGKWDRARMEDLYVVRGTTARTQPVCMTIVGAISSDRSNLQPHGNYDPNFMSLEQIGKRAKLQFVLTSPEEDPDFTSDYALAIKRLKAIQDEVAGSPSKRDHFIQDNNLKMNFYLFQEKEPDQSDSDSDSDSHECTSECEADHKKSKSKQSERVTYEVAGPYRHAWDTVSRTHSNSIMEVYGPNELPINYKDFEKHLRSGTTVVVSFTVKHFGIREKGSSQVSSDTYCATVQSVSILREAERKSRKAVQANPKRRPVPKPQFPSRNSLKMAADTFSPVRQRDVDSASSSTAEPKRQRDDSPMSQGSNASSKRSRSRVIDKSTGSSGSEETATSSSPVHILSPLPHAPPTSGRITREMMNRIAPQILMNLRNRYKNEKYDPIDLEEHMRAQQEKIDPPSDDSTSIVVDSCSDLSELSDDSMPSLEPVDFPPLTQPCARRGISNQSPPLSQSPVACGEHVAEEGAVEEDPSWVKVPAAANVALEDGELQETSNAEEMPESPSNTRFPLRPIMNVRDCVEVTDLIEARNQVDSKKPARYGRKRRNQV